jgi:hypothetical protein
MAAKYSPPWAKNMIRRSLRTVLDPMPSKSDEALLWAHFNERCAFCDRHLPYGDVHRRLDHLKSGVNHISNRVPACGQCNDKEKRDRDWEVFLREKAGTDADAFERRRERINAWIAKTAAEAPALPTGVEEAVREACNAFDAAVGKVKGLQVKQAH